jgi:hypothetical protein
MDKKSKVPSAAGLVFVEDLLGRISSSFSMLICGIKFILSSILVNDSCRTYETRHCCVLQDALISSASSNASALSKLWSLQNKKIILFKPTCIMKVVNTTILLYLTYWETIF